MLDFTRYRNLLIVASGLGLLVGALNFLLVQTLGPSPAWLVPWQTPMGWREIEKSYERVAALAATTAGPAQADSPWWLYIGLSTAGEGIDPDVLCAHTEPRVRAAGLCGSGGSMDNLLALTDALVFWRPQPALAVLCVHPVWLVGHPVERCARPRRPDAAARTSVWRRVRDEVRPWDCLAANRIYVHHAARLGFLALRLRCGAVLPDPDPWRAPPRAGYPPRLDDDVKQLHCAEWARFGWFDPASYDEHQESQKAALRETIRRLDALGCEVLVVLMPEQSLIRQRVPAQAYRHLVDAVQESCPSAPRVLRFEDAIPDEMFTDYLHMNDEGRFRFSVLLGEAIQNRQQHPRRTDESGTVRAASR